MNIWLILSLGFIILVVSAVVGWFIAQWKFSRFVKKVDRKISEPEEILKIQLANLEQQRSIFEKEVRDNERRRILNSGGNGGNTATGRLEGSGGRIAEAIGWPDTEGKPQGQSVLSDADVGEPVEDEQPTRRNTSNPEEDWPDFS